MTKKEFLKQLRAALENNISPTAISENLDYYGSYIDSEIQSGRKEQEVISGLGDPWAIARTIIETEKRSGSGNYTYTVREDETSGESGSNKNSASSSNVKRILVIVLIVAVILAVISAVMGLVVSLLPIIIPVVIVLAIIRLFQQRS